MKTPVMGSFSSLPAMCFKVTLEGHSTLEPSSIQGLRMKIIPFLEIPIYLGTSSTSVDYPLLSLGFVSVKERVSVGESE